MVEGILHPCDLHLQLRIIQQERCFQLMHHKAFHYHVTEEDKKQKVIDKIKTCEKHLENNTVPPKVTNKDIDPQFVGGVDRVTGPSAKICQYCKYKTECSKYL